MKYQEYKLKAKKGVCDYDDKYDILFIGTRKGLYKHSVELDNIVIDLNEKENIRGIQIFDASEYLQIDKQALKNIQKWLFSAEVFENRLTLRLIIEFLRDNKIIERKPIIHHLFNKHYPDSEIVCTS